MSQQELGVTTDKEENPGEWYADVIKKSKIADYAPMGGFIVLRPRGYALWERLQDQLDSRFKETGVQNAYFPMFIPESYLEREKEIVEGFDPEVAWVTHGGYDELEERLAVRPTSESIISPFLSKWTRSHRDLPLRVNQWCSVVRWEATETKPLLRTKEFLWQEGHTAHESGAESDEEMELRLTQYEELYEDLLALPAMTGKKPEHDKFPGARTTTTVETLMPDGRSVQSATSHDLGTSFAEAYDISFVDENEDEQLAHTTSWGLSWRSLGALIMTHSDNNGLVLPPGIAPEQVVIVPIWQSENKDAVLEYADSIESELTDGGIRVEVDDRGNRNPGFKFNEWELKGVPLRIEIGPNEVEDEEATMVHRPDGERAVVDRETIRSSVDEALDTIHSKLYSAAKDTLDENIRSADSAEEIIETIETHGGYVHTGWCGDQACEEVIKDETAAEIVMLPLDESQPPTEGCPACGETATEEVYIAKTH